MAAPLHRIAVAALTVTVALAAQSCGAGGDDDPPPRVRIPEKPEPPPPPETTFVLTDVLPYATPPVVACAAEVAAPGRLPSVGKIVVDGRFGDWATVAPAFVDPVGDAPKGVDFGTAWLGHSGMDLYFAVTARLDPGVALDVELGGLLVSKGVLSGGLRRSFRIVDGKLREWIGSSYVDADPAFWSLATGDGGVEGRISERLLGEAMTWPAFWVRIQTVDPRAPGRHDGAGAVAFGSLLGGDGGVFSFTGCRTWPGQPYPFQWRVVYDRGAAVDSRHDVVPAESIVSWASAVIRAAFDATAVSLGGLDLPAGEATFLLSTAATSRIAGPPTALWRTDSAYDVEVLPVAAMAPGSLDADPDRGVFVAAASRLVRLELLGRFPEAPSSLVDDVATAVTDRVVRQHLGLAYWLDRFGRRDRRGHLLGAHFDARPLVTAWSAAAAKARAGVDPARAFREALAAMRGEETDALAAVEALWTYDPALMRDPDEDGLPTYLEIVLGTRPDRADTDGDGWTDYAEVIAGTDPLASTKNPSAIVPDGSFGDWLVLLPKRVAIDRGHTGTCPKAADITHYAAVAGAEDLIIGAFAADFLEGEAAASWEAVIDLPGQARQLVLSAKSTEFGFVVKDAATGKALWRRERALAMSRGTVEWALSRKALGVAPWTVEKEGLKVRLRTVHRSQGEDRFCDETGWFAPHFNE